MTDPSSQTNGKSPNKTAFIDRYLSSLELMLPLTTNTATTLSVSWSFTGEHTTGIKEAGHV